LWLVHPAARALLPVALRLRVSANIVSAIGFVVGTGAAIAFAHWQTPGMALAGLLLGVLWLICDGLDGMVARATGTASAIGRVMDGVCDHGVFILIYVLIATSIGTEYGWLLAIIAGAAHVVQSSLYEGERARFHRRVRGDAAPIAHPNLGSAIVRGYDAIAGSIDRLAARFDTAMRGAADPAAFGRDYGHAAAPAMKAMSLLSANVRLYAISLACLVQEPTLFWWFEIVALTLVALATITWHRRIEQRLALGFPDTAGLQAGA
jgi:phosphatidylglycerophosphate synthase